MFILNMSLGMFFVYGFNAGDIQAAANLCTSDVDAVLIMDRSGSMDDGGSASKCEWAELQPYLGSHSWFLKTKYDVTEDWCLNTRDSFDESVYHGSFIIPNPRYTPKVNNKIEDAVVAANSFLDNMGLNDQSALVSYADSAVLDKQLSNSHADTKNALDGLTAGGATNIGDAIARANQELSSTRSNPQAVKAAILLTDGLANKPNGNGQDEDPLDIAYAESMASSAAALGFKIFTIGLGEKTAINETMLQNIANMTGAEYYYSPDASELENIYNSISTKICEYGSISGCKYNDSDNDGDISGESKLSGWEINLSGDASLSQSTDSEGCYKFSGLPAGTYTVSETLESGYIQTYPKQKIWEDIVLAEGQDVVDIDFGNYETSDPCVYELSGVKYDSLAKDPIAGWEIELYSAAGALIAATTTDESGHYYFGGLCGNNDYVLKEVLKPGWIQDSPSSPEYYEVSLPAGRGAGYDFYNTPPVLASSSLTVIKESSDNTVSFAFNALDTASSSFDEAFSLKGGESRTFYGLSSSTYNIYETFAGGQSGWQTDNINCDSSFSLDKENSVLVRVEENTGVTCTFRNIYDDPNPVQNPVCGNGIKESGEECDGSAPSGYQCQSDCTLRTIPSSSGGVPPYDGGGAFILDSSASGQEEEPAVLGEEGAPVLRIAKKADKEIINPGEEVEFGIEVSNAGNLTAFSVVLKDILPAGFSFVDGQDGREKTWELGDMPAGGSETVIVKAKADDSAEKGDYENVAEAQAVNHPQVSAAYSVEIKEVAVLAATGIDAAEAFLLLALALGFGSLSFIARKKTA